MEYIQGNAVTLFEQFLDADNEPADPTTIVFYVRDPAGTVTSYTFGVDGEVTHPTNPDPDSPYFGTPVGYYECHLGAPTMVGEWHYRPTGTGALTAASEYEFTIIASSTLTPVSSGPQFGPWTAWCDPQDVIEICPGAVGSETGVLEDFCTAASQVLFENSGRQFWGLSQPVKVRPPNADGCGCWPWNETWHSWGQTQVGWWSWDSGLGRWGCGGQWYGCQPLSRVKLGGYPAREITQVKVNGDVVDPTLYRLDENRWLVHMRDTASPDAQLFWPSCQILDLPDTEQGTFSVTYRWGQDPPQQGKDAARALACELFKATPLGGGDCQLPPTARRATRQGVSVELVAFAQLWDGARRTWMTGVPAVDLFLNTYNPARLRRRPSVSSPWTRPFPLVPGA